MTEQTALPNFWLTQDGLSNNSIAVDFFASKRQVFPSPAVCSKMEHTEFSPQLSGVENVEPMLGDRRTLHPEQLRQRLLRQPDGLVLHENVHLHHPVRRGVDEELVGFVHTPIC